MKKVDENGNPVDDGTPNDPPEDPPAQDPPEAELVSLERDQYEALLDRLDELEELAIRGPAKPPESVDDLAQRATRPTERPGMPDPEKMTNTQLLQVIADHVNQSVAQPLLERIEEIRVTAEIRDLRKALRETEDGDDFDQWKDKIYEVGVRNPALSIEEAYHLAKRGAKPKKAEKKEGRSENRNHLLRTLPRPPHSEKPGHPKSVTAQGDPKTRKAAAQRAMEELRSKGMM